MNTDHSLKLTAFFRLTAVAVIILLSVMPLMAQPSGGPYGPVRQPWPVPQTGGRIFYVAPDAISEASGETVAALTTIESAI